MNSHQRSAWKILQIAPTRDVRAIKKAYAAQLKLNRPDDDPAAFQRVCEAYEWALAEAQSLTVESPEDFDDTDLPQVKLPQLELPQVANELGIEMPRQTADLAITSSVDPNSGSAANIAREYFSVSFQTLPLGPDISPKLGPELRMPLDPDAENPSSTEGSHQAPKEFQLATLSSAQIEQVIEQIRRTAFPGLDMALETIRNLDAYVSLAIRAEFESRCLHSILQQQEWHWTTLIAIEQLFEWRLVGNLPPPPVLATLRYAHLHHRVSKMPAPRGWWDFSDEAMFWRWQRPISAAQRRWYVLMPIKAQFERISAWLDDAGFGLEAAIDESQLQFWSTVLSPAHSWQKYLVMLWRCIMIAAAIALIPGLMSRQPGVLLKAWLATGVSLCFYGSIAYLLVHSIRTLTKYFQGR